MNIYTVDANDLATYTKYKEDVCNLKKPRKTLDNLSIGIYIIFIVTFKY